MKNMKNIKTEGIRYSGSKKEILPKILEMSEKLDVKNVLDAFAGTTRVSQMYKNFNYNVDCNDISHYSKVFGNCYLINNNPKQFFKEKIDYLNNLEGKIGWFSENYGGSSNSTTSVQSDGKKRPFQLHNTMRLDSIRSEIDKISDNEIEKSVLLTSLILALDKVDNTLGHQVSYLKDWSARSYNKMVLEVPELIVKEGEYNSFSQDIFTIDKKYDLVYMDPPYGTNNEKTKTTRVRYASYYHLWTTVVKNDQPKVFGAANRREDASSDTLPGAISVFENTNYNNVVNSVINLIKNINTKYIIFSYNNKSKIKIDDLIAIFSQYNLIETLPFSHKENIQKKLTTNKNYMGDTKENLEYLFLIEK
jgi:adenine-specific DNA-methyltransferase